MVYGIGQAVKSEERQRGVGVKILGILTAVREIMLIVLITLLTMAIVSALNTNQYEDIFEEVSDINFNYEKVEGDGCTQISQSWLMV